MAKRERVVVYVMEKEAKRKGERGTEGRTQYNGGDAREDLLCRGEREKRTGPFGA